MNPQLKNLFTIPSVHAEPIDPDEMEELESIFEIKRTSLRRHQIYRNKETDMRITVNQLRRIIKEEVSRLSRRRVVENMHASGENVIYNHPDIPIKDMVGTIEYDEFERKEVFMPHPRYASKLLNLGYESEGGLFLDGADVAPAHSWGGL